MHLFKTFFSSALFICISIDTLFAQVTFYKSYSGMQTIAVRELNTRDFIVIGNESGSIVLVKTDFQGEILWSNKYGDGVSAKCIQQTSDNGFIIVGTIAEGSWPNINNEVLLIKTDNDGVMQWSKKYGGSLNEYGWWVEQTSDGGFIISGVANDGIDDETWGDVYLIKTDNVGNLMWDKVFAFGGNAAGQNIKQTNDGGYIITGNDDREMVGLGKEDVFLIKTDALGKIQWKYSYEIRYNGCGGASSGREVWPVLSGGYIVAGYVVDEFGSCQSEAFLLKVHTNGLVDKVNTYKNPNPNDGAGFSSMDITDDGGFITIGGGGYDEYDDCVCPTTFMVKVKADLSFQWSRFYNVMEYGNSIRQTHDKGYSLVADPYRGSIMKTDVSGLIDCFIPTSLMLSQAAVKNEQLSITVSSITKHSIPTVLEKNNNIITETICEPSIKEIENPFYIPNSFTPNKDDINDLFFPKGVGISDENFKFIIFDRWGNLIWQTTTWGEGWDGRANGGKEVAQQDVYVWKIQYTNTLSEEYQLTGHVNLIR